VSLIAQLAVPSIKHLLAIEDQHTRQLSAIQSTVEAQLEGPYHAALIHLARASSTTASSEERADSLRLAEQRFIDAVGNFKREPLQRSWAEIQLAGICMLDNQAGQARQWAAQAHADAVKGTEIECEAVTDRMRGRTGRVKALPSVPGNSLRAKSALVVGTGAFWTVVFPPAAVGFAGMGVWYGAASVYQRSVANRSRAKLEELSAYVDQVADLLRCLGAGDVARHSLSVVDGFPVFRELAPWELVKDLERLVVSRVGDRQPPAARPTEAAKPLGAAKRTPAPVRAPRGENKAKILEALKGRAPMTASEVAKVTGIPSATVSTTLTKMAKTGELVKAERGYTLPR
jgi:hypothetical protein